MSTVRPRRDPAEDAALDDPGFAPILRHVGFCGRRVLCYRSACRDRFGDLRTVEVLDQAAVFYCHRVRVALDPVVLAQLAAVA